jgi:Ca2+-binding EF-hand superfamily protein
VGYFDIDKDGALSYTEFLQMVLPCDDMVLRSNVTQRETCANFDPRMHTRLPLNIEKALTVFFEKEIELHAMIREQKRKISELPSWSPRAAFETLLRYDSTYGDYLSHNNIQEFLKTQGLSGREAEVIAIIRRLDSNAD